MSTAVIDDRFGSEAVDDVRQLPSFTGVTLPSDSSENLWDDQPTPETMMDIYSSAHNAVWTQPFSVAKYRLLQKWEGMVLEVGDDSFVARLYELPNDSEPEEAEIPVSELADSEKELLMSGAVFYWTIGYHDRPSGRVRESSIRFRRLPAWSRQELESAEQKAAGLRQEWGIE